MNRRDMKKLVKQRLGSFLLFYGGSEHARTPWRDVPDFFDELEIWVFRDRQPTPAERRRLLSVYLELHENWRA